MAEALVAQWNRSECPELNKNFVVGSNNLPNHEKPKSHANKLNVLTRASFETPLKHISKGAIMNESNRLNSITENVMTNQMVYVGTGMPKIAVKSKK